MSSPRSADYLVSLVRELCALPGETEWVEFKVNEAEPQGIGEYISALSNTAALVGKAFSYLVWGVRNVDQVLLPKLPDRLTREQKLRKVNNLLQELRRSGRIENRGGRANPEWVAARANSDGGSS